MVRQRVTMADVATRAGVSKATVSLAFNNPSRLAEGTVRRVHDVARELGYTRNPAARMLRTQRTNSLGILFPQQLDLVFENPYYSAFLQGVGHVCRDEGYAALLVPPVRDSMLKAIPHAAVDGFIVSGLEDDRGEVELLRQRRIPFVLVDSEHLDDVASVEIDDGQGIAEIVRHLLDLGHRRIAFIAFETAIEGGYRNWRGPIRRRMQGAESALATAGLELDSPEITILETSCTRAGGASAFRELWSRSERPTAVVAMADIIALGVLDAAREQGVSVPGEVSVTGFDDVTEAAWTSPALTTIRQPIVTKGRVAAEYLIEAIASNSPTADRPHRQLHSTVLIRESVGPSPRI